VITVEEGFLHSLGYISTDYAIIRSYFRDSIATPDDGITSPNVRVSIRNKTIYIFQYSLFQYSIYISADGSIVSSR
jgi:hypothetical protein